MSMNSEDPPSDRELCEVVRSSDEQVARLAFEHLWRRHRRVVWGTICRLFGGSSEAAMDLYQQVCVGLWTYLRSTPHWQLQQESLLPYLTRCVRNGFVDRLRQQRRMQSVESLDDLARQGVEPLHSATNAPREGPNDGDNAYLMLGLLSANALGSSELAERLGMSPEQLKVAGVNAEEELRHWGETRFLQAINQLTPKSRDAFVLQEGFGFHQDEIATILDISKSAVSQRVADAKWRVRDTYTKMLMEAGYTLREIAITLGLLDPTEHSPEGEAEAIGEVLRLINRDETRRKKGGTPE